MNLRHMLFAALSCIVIIGVTSYSQNDGAPPNGSQDTSVKGHQGGPNDMNRGVDSTLIKGVIESVDSSNNTIIIRTDTITDTVYFNDQTKFRLPKENLAKGEKVIVKYNIVDNKKVATYVIAASKKAKKSPKKPDTSAAPGAPDTTKQY